MREDHRGLPRLAVRRQPQQAPDEGTVVGDDADRLTRQIDTGIVLG
jgi:hypothetical protein